jgi:hypothetical protein
MGHARFSVKKKLNQIIVSTTIRDRAKSTVDNRRLGTQQGSHLDSCWTCLIEMLYPSYCLAYNHG